MKQKCFKPPITLFLLLFFTALYGNAQEKEKVLSFAKGTWHTAVTLSIKDTKDDNIDNLLFKINENKTNSFEVNILGGYFFKDYMSTGMRYSYLKRERNLNYQTDSNDQVRRQYALSRHTFVGFIRNYFPISADNRFNFFNETDLGIGFGNSNLRHTKSETDITKTYTDDYNLKLGIRPGIAIVIVEGFSFEVAVDLLGLNYTHHKETANGTSQGTSSDFNFDFDISLLSLGFGLAYYF
ncbi:MAG: hypothetical protein ACK5MZ_11710 [Aestuariibaculum sp.]